jgi:sulfoxide reductase catalytic subunit YedY
MEITPKSVWLRRREFLKLGAAGAGALLAKPAFARATTPHGPKLAGVKPNPKYGDAGEKQTPFEDITTYNNFYELGTDKGDPSANAAALKTRPWTVEIAGEVGKPRKWDIEEILKTFPIEERVYRLRCVEAWVDGDPVGRLSAGRSAEEG